MSRRLISYRTKYQLFKDNSAQNGSPLEMEEPIEWSSEESKKLDRLHAIEGHHSLLTHCPLIVFNLERAQRVCDIMDSLCQELRDNKQKLKDCQESLESERRHVKKLEKKVKHYELKGETNPKLVQLKDKLKEKDKEIEKLSAIVSSTKNLISQMDSKKKSEIKAIKDDALKSFANIMSQRFNALIYELTEFLDKNDNHSIKSKDKELIISQVKRFRDQTLKRLPENKSLAQKSDNKNKFKAPLKTRNN